MQLQLFGTSQLKTMLSHIIKFDKALFLSVPCSHAEAGGAERPAPPQQQAGHDRGAAGRRGARLQARHRPAHAGQEEGGLLQEEEDPLRRPDGAQ